MSSGLGASGMRGRLDLGVVLPPVERARQVEDGSAGLAGHDRPGAEAAAVAEAVDLEPHRLRATSPPRMK